VHSLPRFSANSIQNCPSVNSKQSMTSLWPNTSDQNLLKKLKGCVLNLLPQQPALSVLAQWRPGAETCAMRATSMWDAIPTQLPLSSIYQESIDNFIKEHHKKLFDSSLQDGLNPAMALKMDLKAWRNMILCRCVGSKFYYYHFKGYVIKKPRHGSLKHYCVKWSLYESWMFGVKNIMLSFHV